MNPSETLLATEPKKKKGKLTARTKWLLFAPVGLILVGYGLCEFSEAGFIKHSGGPTTDWVLRGTYSLILINGGLSLFGQAVYYRVIMDVRKETRRSLRKLETKLSKAGGKRPNRNRKRKSPPAGEAPKSN